MNTLEKNIYNQLTENTGTHFLDSGGDSNRHWQKNKINDIRKKPLYEIDTNEDDECIIYVSTYHHLINVLEDDWFTAKINHLIGVNKSVFWVQEVIELILERYNIENVSNTFNTYSFGSPLIQDVLYITFEFDGEYYCILQTHNGADIRGGYSTAKCYKFIDYYTYPISPIVYGEALNGEELESHEGYFNTKINESSIYVI